MFPSQGLFYGACCSMTSALCLCQTILLISSAVIASAFAITAITSATLHLAADASVALKGHNHTPPPWGHPPEKSRAQKTKR